MTRFSPILGSWTVCLLGAFCASSESAGPCTVACGLPLAFSVTVTSAVSAGPVAGAYVSGDPYGTGDGNRCNQALDSTCCDQAPASTCYLRGFDGQYSLQIGAPGFQSVQRSITIAPGSGGRCCPGTIPGHFDVALAPATSASSDARYSVSSTRPNPARSDPGRYTGPMRC
jgi:hypothetical protein